MSQPLNYSVHQSIQQYKCCFTVSRCKCSSHKLIRNAPICAKWADADIQHFSCTCQSICQRNVTFIYLFFFTRFSYRRPVSPKRSAFLENKKKKKHTIKYQFEISVRSKHQSDADIVAVQKKSEYLQNGKFYKGGQKMFFTFKASDFIPSNFGAFLLIQSS